VQAVLHLLNVGHLDEEQARQAVHRGPDLELTSAILDDDPSEGVSPPSAESDRFLAVDDDLFPLECHDGILQDKLGATGCRSGRQLSAEPPPGACRGTDAGTGTLVRKQHDAAVRSSSTIARSSSVNTTLLSHERLWAMSDQVRTSRALFSAEVESVQSGVDPA
jgi:hypothetical protein